MRNDKMRNDKAGEKRTRSGGLRMAAAAILAAGILAACGGQQQSAAITQPIAETALTGAAANAPSEAALSETTAAKESEAAAAKGAALSASAPSAASAESSAAAYEPSGDLETDLANYCRLKAEEEAIGVDIGKLEAAFRVGSIAEKDFRAQKEALVAQENDTERQADMLENAVDLAYYQAGQTAPQGDVKTLLSKKQELERSQHETELAGDKLENDYWNDKLTRDEFVSQMAEHIRTEEDLERQEELLEDALERMGWDD